MKVLKIIEGFTLLISQNFFHSGDVMYDNSIFFEDKAKESSIINNLKLKENSFILATIHRNQNTDNIERLQQIFDGLLEIIDKYKLEIVLPLHPRTKKSIKSIKCNHPKIY